MRLNTAVHSEKQPVYNKNLIVN